MFVISASACKKEKKKEEPLEDPCGLFCERVQGCCEGGGLSNCGDVVDLCLWGCEALRMENKDSDINFDHIAACVNENASCYQLLGVDEWRLEETYTDCLGAETECEFVDTCPTDGEQHCCEGTLATCQYGNWVIYPCQSLCLEEGLIYSGTCDDSSGTESCNCSAPPSPCQLYCTKAIEYCEEWEWEGCAEEGIESCILLEPDCLTECAAVVEPLTTSGVDADAVTMCLWRHATALQILGCEDADFRTTLTNCIADVTDCTHTGSCETEDETHCCPGTLATCTSGAWVIDACSLICETLTPETPTWTGVCESVATVDTCICE
jgi:hypothetical protein